MSIALSIPRSATTGPLLGESVGVLSLFYSACGSIRLVSVFGVIKGEDRECGEGKKKG